ncbi:septal ring lytic transglycosylase RlpA family protein [Siansivirga zeaxanthinifaciens]|uniref:Probable endolytic peptidoglycan transglycosylase RlpA n=1 Tax=Siansivirga zeaxanthinifaciens CC-SAMT-1 TaxID=1454006 RepID=A0A0C5WB42_9FLAO|nr:septal ring lytic transglycosylase RlpA family protein [Siansivirga zeaxanthinifaciens]AJR04323.1 lipoprotein [Siansivirga zeaxanthinifaciens CC-SAMT-1]
MKGFIKQSGLVLVLLVIYGFTISKKPNTITSKYNLESPLIFKDTTETDSISITYTPYKENVHASYYHDKFNGRRTASGEKFDNNNFTAAHKFLKFGTKLKITNTVNDSSVVVTVNDRGPFVKGREIDLSKKAFMQIAKNKLKGHLLVNIEILEETAIDSTKN